MKIIDNELNLGRNIRIVTPDPLSSYQQIDGLGNADLYPPLYLGYLGNHYRSLENTENKEASPDSREELLPLIDNEESANSETTITAGEDTLSADEPTISVDERIIVAEVEEERQNFQV